MKVQTVIRHTMIIRKSDEVISLKIDRIIPQHLHRRIYDLMNSWPAGISVYQLGRVHERKGQVFSCIEEY